MPQSASRIVLGTNSRRGPQKAHIPFRGDDLEHGKKTGKTVNKVSRDSDDFEPFEDVLDQAYTGGNVFRAANNNPKLVNGKVWRGPPSIPEDGDENGELSMDIDSTHNSPSTYFNTTIAPQPSSAKRAGSSSRAIPRGSDVDYDRIPSPKPPRRSSARPLNPSRLRHEVQDDEDEEPRAHDGHYNMGFNDHQDEYNHPEGDDAIFDGSPSMGSHRNMSFTELAQDDDDEAELPEDEDQSPLVTRTDKGKGRAEPQEDSDVNEDAGIEDDIAAGLQELEVEHVNEDGEEEAPGPSNKRLRKGDGESISESQVRKPGKRQNSKRVQEQLRPHMHETTNQEGLRRSQRRHYAPLEYWRQEKVVYGRREKEKGPSYVPVIKEIITIPKLPVQPLGSKKRKRGGTQAPKSKSRSLAPEVQEEVHVVEVDNPELGWDDETPAHGVIINLDTGEEVQRRVAFTAKMVKPVKAGNSNYFFQKIFGDGDFIAGGQLVIPPGQEKPTKPTKDNTYIFYLIEGAVQFRVHRSSFILATGGMFLVPRGNQYYIENICERDAKLFFAQARKIVEGESQFPTVQSRMSAPPRSHTALRSSSHGASSPKQQK